METTTTFLARMLVNTRAGDAIANRDEARLRNLAAGGPDYEPVETFEQREYAIPGRDTAPAPEPQSRSSIR